MINQSIRAGALRVAALVLGVASMLNAGTAPAGAQEVTLYSTREAALTTPILGKFTSQTGIPVNFVQFKTINELMEKLAKDGDQSTADMAIIPDIGGLFDLVSARLTQPVQSRELDNAIPPNLKHPTNMWVALSYRIRAIYVSKDRVADRPTTYRDLADPRYEGRLCIRSGTHPYNSAWFAAMLLKEGEGLTALYMQSLRRNLA